MAQIYADRVLETSSTTGTGALTLAGAVTGYRTWGAVCANGDTGYYYIEAVDANGIPTGQWETGLGTWGTGGILTRTTPAAGSAATPVSFTGTLRVALTITAASIRTVTGPITFNEAVGSSALTITGATQTSNFPALNITQTWNNAGVAFDSIKVNVTNTASAVGSNLLVLQTGGVNRCVVNTSGGISAQGLVCTSTISTSINQVISWTNGSRLSCIVNGDFYFSNWAGTNVFYLSVPVSATIQQGQADAASPVAQTYQAQGSRTGTDTNVAGANLTIRSGKGTGNATGSTLILQSYVAVASGTGAQTATTGLTIQNGAYVSTAYTVATLPATPVQGMRAHVTDSNAASYTAGIGAVVAAGGTTVVPVFYDGTNWRIG